MNNTELNIIDGKFSICNKEFILPNYNKLKKSFTANTLINCHFHIYELSFLGKYKNKLYFILEEGYDDYGNRPIYIFNEKFDIIISFHISIEDEIKYFDEENGNIVTNSKTIKID